VQWGFFANGLPIGMPDRGTALAGGFGTAVGARLRVGETNGLVSQTVIYLHHALHLHGNAITHVRIVTPLLGGFQC
jgi:hypothetical protein